MRLGTLAPIAAAVTLAATAEAQYIGFSTTADGSGTACIGPPATFPSIVTLYVVANTVAIPGSEFIGAEFAIRGLDEGNPPAQPYITMFTPNPAAGVVVGDPMGGGINLAFSGCQTGDVVLGTLTLFNQGDTELRQLRVAPRDPPSNVDFDCPVLILCPGPLWTAVCASGGTAYLNIPEDPPPATDPYPADGATGVPLQIALEWSIPTTQQEVCAGDGTIAMDIYFGTEPDPPYLDTSTLARQWTLPLLQPETTYYWRIAAGLHTSPVWSFATGPFIGVETTTWGEVRSFYR